MFGTSGHISIGYPPVFILGFQPGGNPRGERIRISDPGGSGPHPGGEWTKIGPGASRQGGNPRGEQIGFQNPGGGVSPPAPPAGGERINTAPYPVDASPELWSQSENSMTLYPISNIDDRIENICRGKPNFRIGT